MNDNEILRGFEIVKNDIFGRKSSVVKYRPTELAAKQAAADVKWFQWRWPNAGYELRALVSVPHEEPKVLTEDPPTPEEVLAVARVANGEYDVVPQ